MARPLAVWLAWCALLGLPDAAHGYCIRQPPSNPRRIQYNNSSYRFPLGYGVWSSPQPVAEIINILLTEEMGVDVDLKPPLGGSQILLQAIAGCSSNCSQEAHDTGGFADPPPVWAAAEVWTAGLEEKRLMQFCASAGPIGYVSTPSLQTFSRVHQAAEQAGELTAFWRSLYKPEARRFYSTVAEVEAMISQLTVPMSFAGFFGCNATTCAQPGLVRPGTENGRAVALNADEDLIGNGVNVSSDGWYYAPGCAHNHSECVPVILGAQVWNHLEWCLVAKEQNLPLAITFLGWFGEILTVQGLFNAGLNALFYWWQPDNTFLSLSPEMSFFTEDILRIRQFQYNKKVIWKKLSSVDKDINHFLSKVSFTNADMDQMMVELGTSSTRDIACKWVRNNTAAWADWIPDPTNCRRGFYYNSTERMCKACQPGTVTSLFGRRSCDVCPPGTNSLSLAGTECSICETGKYASQGGQSLCDFCPKGEYSNDTRLTDCHPCPAGFTTAQIASVHPSACKCHDGTYEAANEKVCRPCLPGMSCPFGSKEANIPRQPGHSSVDATCDAPQVKEGFFSEYSSPMSIYQCRLKSHCPGGPPQSCAGERYGIACSLCPAGLNPTENGCTPCNEGTTIAAIVLTSLGFLAFPVGIYYAANSRVTVVTTGLAGCTVSGGIVVTSLQVLATYQRLELPWPESSGGLMNYFQFLLFELEAIGAQCVIGNKAEVNYLFRVGFSYVMVLLFWVCFFVFKVVGKFKPHLTWDAKKTVNSIGAFLQIAFISLVGIAVIPLHCYKHPNKLWSVNFYPSVLCWQGGGAQVPLILLSVFLLLTLIIPFLVANIVAAIKAPAASRKWGGNSTVIICFRFLLYRYRPDVWWWGNVFSVRQALVAFTPTIAANDANIQMMLIATTLIVYLVLMGVYWPWKNSELNTLDLLSVIFLLLIAVTAGSFMKETQATEAHSVILLSFLLIVMVINCALVIYAAIVFYKRGLNGSFGMKYPRKKDLHRFAHEWRALCSYHKDLTTDECGEWLRSMSNFDRWAINMTISIGQAYSIGGDRRIVSERIPGRLILDQEGGRPSQLEHHDSSLAKGKGVGAIHARVSV